MSDIKDQGIVCWDKNLQKQLLGFSYLSFTLKSLLRSYYRDFRVQKTFLLFIWQSMLDFKKTYFVWYRSKTFFAGNRGNGIKKSY